jgi:hypothetical protein
MNRINLILAFFYLSNSFSDTIDYHIDNNNYAVVVIESNIARPDAKKLALQKAAEIAKSHGYQYFTISSQEEVVVLKTEQSSRLESAPQNLYYEMIQSDNFNKERMSSNQAVPGNAYPAWKVKFSCFKDKPQGTSYAVCDQLKCSQ